MSNIKEIIKDLEKRNPNLKQLNPKHDIIDGFYHFGIFSGGKYDKIFNFTVVITYLRTEDEIEEGIEIEIRGKEIEEYFEP